MDAAHGKLFTNRMGRHSGLGPNDVEGYSSIAEQKSLRSFFTGSGEDGEDSPERCSHSDVPLFILYR